MVAILDRLGIILFIVAALVVGPMLLLALWTHAIALEMWHRLNKPSKEKWPTASRLYSVPIRPN